MFNWIVTHSLHNRLFVLAFAVIVLLYGGLTAQQMPVDVFPDLNKPTVTIMSEAGGMAPEEVEQLVSFPIETALNGLEDVDEIQSTSQAGLASIGVSFVYGSDPEKKYDEVVRELNVIRASLPEGITLLRANRQNPAQTNIVQMALVSETASYRRIEAYARELRDAIERAGEVRFLPVLLTSLTAIGGLTPLVLEKSPLYSPLAMVIIGGLISSTLIARIVTPPMYLLLARTRHGSRVLPQETAQVPSHPGDVLVAK